MESRDHSCLSQTPISPVLVDARRRPDGDRESSDKDEYTTVLRGQHKENLEGRRGCFGSFSSLARRLMTLTHRCTHSLSPR